MGDFNKIAFDRAIIEHIPDVLEIGGIHTYFTPNGSYKNDYFYVTKECRNTLRLRLEHRTVMDDHLSYAIQLRHQKKPLRTLLVQTKSEIRIIRYPDTNAIMIPDGDGGFTPPEDPLKELLHVISTKVITKDSTNDCP